MIKFTVLGNPVAKARTKAYYNKYTGRAGVYTPSNTRNFEAYVRQIAAEHAPETLLDCPLGIEMVFYLQKPKSASKKVIFPATKPDLDNLCKSICDAMEGIIYTNDSRAVNKTLAKRYGDPPRVEVMIYEIEIPSGKKEAL